MGVWNVSVDITNCATGATIASREPRAASREAMALFAADGTRHETNAINPALRSPAFGNWRHPENNEYQFAFRFFGFDAAGAYRLANHPARLRSVG